MTNLKLLALAWSFGWRIAAGVLVGYALDVRLDTAPVLTLLLSMTALATSVVQIIRALDKDGSKPRRGVKGDQDET